MLTHLRWLGRLAVLVLAAGTVRADTSGLLINSRNEVLVRSDGEPARLRHQPGARDRSLAEVLAFIARDHTNRRPYVAGAFMCTEYALSVQQHAEAAGIRCGIVSLSFSAGVGHALNVFRTTDHGVVYVDCTGAPNGDATDAYDTFGYIAIGKPYGRLHVDLGAKNPSDYRKYEEAKSVFRNLEKWDRQMALEQSALEKAVREFQTQSAAKTKANASALRDRVDHFNHMLDYRNALAKTFRLWYDEDNAVVTRMDVFW